MPARSFGYAEVEERLQEIRRRLNLLVLQQALYASASAGLLTAALLIVVALFAGSAAFRLSLWLALPVLVATVALAVRFVARRLVSLEATARFADRKAQLQDRLATLHAHGRARSPSRLADLLLAETLNFSPRWRVSALGLRQISRSIYLVVLSIALLGATAFLGPSPQENADAPARPQDRKAPESEKRPPTSVQRLMLQSSMSDGTADTGVASGGARSTDGNTNKTGAARSSKNDSKLTPSEGRGQAMAANQEVDADTASQLQRLIRDALGQSEEQEKNPGAARDLAGGKPPGSRRSRSEKRAGDGTRPESKPNDGSQQADRAERAEARGRPQASGAAEGSKSAREGGTGTSGALYGSAKPAASERADSQTFALRLMGSSTARMQLEPQGKGQPATLEEGVATQEEASLPEVPEQEVPDGALHRAEISPEHEAILGRIFHRD